MTSLHYPTAPRATYRLQMTKDFTFRQAAGLAPYLQRLGISHAYLSPILKARKGSTHGYDTVDHTMINPELGTRGDFDDMAATFRSHGIGIALDIVPNHMGVGGDENPYWLDVLERGPLSPYADWFDINWSPSEPTLKNKILVPFLGASLNESLEKGTVELRHDEAAHSFAVWAEDTHKLPLRPDTYAMVNNGGPPQAAVDRLNSPEGRADLMAIMDAQHWKLARFSAGADDINYRRFFIVSDLAGIRIERPEVFEHVHRLVFELVEQGLVQGLRVDHVDGLYDPKAYALALRQKAPRPIYLVVEKILAPNEMLQPEWGVDGTTGYEFAGAATRLLVDPAGDAKLTDAYEQYTRQSQTLAHIEYEAKCDIIDFEMAAELDDLADRLRAIAVQHAATADLTRNTLRNVLREVVASMPVYRTYVDETGASDSDRRFVGVAMGKARRTLHGLDPSAFDFVEAVMRGQPVPATSTAASDLILGTALRIQQYTGPVMAKGLEDTALYRYNRLIALSDVGEKPDRLSGSIAAFHDFNVARHQNMPLGMLTTSSHDSKRGEDARARIAALSGRPEQWIAAVAEWSGLLEAAGAPEIEPNDRYYFLQLLVGSWPLQFAESGDLPSGQLQAFQNRLDAAMRKSVRESRVRTNWNAPDTDYEAAIAKYVATALRAEGAFLEAFRRFDRDIGPEGAQNSIIETVLKLTVPGVPDIYQGAELWEQSMVDPDNRRPVDFDARVQALGPEASFGELVTHWRDGRLKQRVIAELLACRADNPELFAQGTYEPVVAPNDAVCAFVRRSKSATLLVAVQLYPWRSRPRSDAAFQLPTGSPETRWYSVLGDDRGAVSDFTANGLLRSLPAAVLVTAKHRPLDPSSRPSRSLLPLG